jgi:hypothetical protein
MYPIHRICWVTCESMGLITNPNREARIRILQVYNIVIWRLTDLVMRGMLPHSIISNFEFMLATATNMDVGPSAAYLGLGTGSCIASPPPLRHPLLLCRCHAQITLSCGLSSVGVDPLAIHVVSGLSSTR